MSRSPKLSVLMGPSWNHCLHDLGMPTEPQVAEALLAALVRSFRQVSDRNEHLEPLCASFWLLRVASELSPKARVTHIFHSGVSLSMIRGVGASMLMDVSAATSPCLPERESAGDSASGTPPATAMRTVQAAVVCITELSIDDRLKPGTVASPDAFACPRYSWNTACGSWYGAPDPTTTDSLMPS